MKVVLLNILLVVGFIGCLQIITERATLEYINEKYVDNVSIFIKRYGRKSPYYLNIIGRTKHTWNNNVTVNLILYEYLHNEYRRSFVELHLRLCDMINSDPYVGAMIANAGITCPLYPNLQRLVNMTMPTADFKYVMPFKKCMGEMDITVTATRESIGKARFYMTFVDKNKHV